MFRLVRRDIGACQSNAATNCWQRFWAMERAKFTVPPLPGSNMNADAIHAALGVAFTAVWLIVGQILVGNR